jgi:hypothetical protein
MTSPHSRKPTKRPKHKPFTASQKAAILRLYIRHRLSTAETAKRLRLSVHRVIRFLRKRDVMRRQGSPPGTPRKISVAARRNLERQLPTTMDVVLARKYGLSRERIRQIRQELGCSSSRVLRRAWAARARAKRWEQEKLALELRQQQRQAKRLRAINRLSKRWKSGAPVAQLAREVGYTVDSMNTQIGRLRKQFPEKFPYRPRLRSPSHPGAVVRQ